MTTRNRPLSPHLQVYRLPFDAILSISHRITGVILCFGAVLLTYWLMAATYGPEAFATAQSILGSWFGLLVLLGVVFSLWYHLANGMRHLLWDTGRGLELDQLRKSGIAVIAVAAVLTLGTFILAYAVGG
ncbi:MAG: succinate dehydrogenase, cytochrome b556 subunit [Rhodospirillales bacterium]